MALIVVLLTTVTFVAAVPPRDTVAPGRKPLPAILIEVPPAVVPELGVMLLTSGGATKVYPFVRVPLSPPVLVTTTLTAPAE